jgi:hypothetical protein
MLLLRRGEGIRRDRIFVAVADHEAAIGALHHDQVNTARHVVHLLGQ